VVVLVAGHHVRRPVVRPGHAGEESGVELQVPSSVVGASQSSMSIVTALSAPGRLRVMVTTCSATSYSTISLIAAPDGCLPLRRSFPERYNELYCIGGRGYVLLIV
jgi:hypothetical protein